MMQTPSPNPTVAFMQAVYRDIDSRDIQRLLAHLTPDCHFVFGNAPPLAGHAEVAAQVGGFLGVIAGIRHDVDEAWQVGDVVIGRLRVTYTRHDGAVRSYPAAVIWRLQGPLVHEFRIYVDNSTLFTDPPAEATR